MIMSARLSILASLVLATGLTACGMTENDPERFQKVAEQVASIPLSVEGGRAGEKSQAPLQVQLMTPHQLWDARDGVKPKVPTVIMADEALIDPEAELVTAAPTSAPRVQSETYRTIQLGAYASAQAARNAWAGMGAATAGLEPLYERVEVGERSLVRLKVRASDERARQLCGRLAAADPWCLKGV